MKVVITNGYTWNNKGDAGIVIGTIESIRQVFGADTEFTVLTGTPEIDSENYSKCGVNATFVNRMLIAKKIYLGFIPYNSYILFLQVAISNLKMLFAKRYLDKHKDNYRALKEADLIVVCGGGYLGGDTFFGNFSHLHQVKINLKYHKKTIVLGGSVEPSTKWYVRSMLKNTLKKVDQFYSREYITTQFLEEIGLKNVTEIPDLAFFFSEGKAPINVRTYYELNDNQMIVGITMRDCFKKYEYMQYKNSYIQAMREIMLCLIEKYNCFICCIPFCQNAGDNDMVISKEVIDGLGAEYHKNISILEHDMDPAQLKGVLKQFDCFLGTRMHSNIFAMSVGVPTTAIKYEEKTQGIMKMMGMEDAVFDAYHLDAEGVINSIERHMQNRVEISNKIEKRVKELRKEIDNELKKSYL